MIPRNFNLPDGCSDEDIDPPEYNESFGDRQAEEDDRQREIANDGL